MDYLSERSGPNFGTNPDVKRFSADVILDKLDKFKTKLKKTAITRENLIEFVAQEFGLSMTMLTATDAILFCRGPGLDQSEQYNEDKLIHWLQASLPGMRKIEDKIEPKRLPAKSLNTSQDNFHLFKLSGVGTLKNMHSQRHSRTTSMQQDQNQNVLK